MSITTAGDIIGLALKQAGAIGVGQTALAEDVNDAFALLNMMIRQWNRRRWMIYHLLDVGITSTGAQNYSIGPGAAFDVPRPDRLEGAYAKLVTTGGPIIPGPFTSAFNGAFASGTPSGQGIDYPLTLIQSMEDYSRIAFKTLGTFPQAIFYDSDFPTGTIYVWPVPSSRFEIHLLIKDELAAFAKLTDQIFLPPEYFEAILLNLIVRLWDQYQLPPRPTTMALARAALNTIVQANTQVPLLKLPEGLRRGGGWYNGFSDQFY